MAYMDLNYALRSDAELLHALTILQKRAQELFKNGDELYKVAEKKELIYQIFRLCGNNVSLLVPYFFPTGDKGKPLRPTSRPYSLEMYKMGFFSTTSIRGSRQIGKSTAIAAALLILCYIIPNYKYIYVVPYFKQLDTFANKLKELYDNFRFKMPNKHNNKIYKQNKYMIEFANGSSVELIYCCENSKNARSKSTDVLILDEVQQLNMSLWPDIRHTLDASHRRAVIFSGTSTDLSSPLEVEYQHGSCSTFHLRSPGPGRPWINMGDAALIYEQGMMSPEGLKCPYTGVLIRDVTDGMYVPEYPDRLDQGKISIHCSCLIVPEMVHNRLKYAEIYEAFIRDDRVKFLRETVGIPSADAMREVSEYDLKALCNLPDGTAELLRKAKKGEYRYVFSSVDWGGSDYEATGNKVKQSYTVHCIFGLKQDGTLELIYIKRFSGMNFLRISKEIADKHKEYNCDTAVSDFGNGSCYNVQLRNMGFNPSRHFIIGYTGPNSKIFGKMEVELSNVYSLNRTEAITMLYNEIKKDPSRFRVGPWEENKQYLSDFLNLIRVMTEDGHGRSTFLYIKTPGSDDVCHCFVWALVMAKLLLGEPLFEDKALAEQIRRALRGGNSIVPVGMNPHDINKLVRMW